MKSLFLQTEKLIKRYKLALNIHKQEIQKNEKTLLPYEEPEVINIDKDTNMAVKYANNITNNYCG